MASNAADVFPVVGLARATVSKVAENKADAGGDNVYDVTISASDGVNTTSKSVAITVADVNEDPTITSASSATFAENTAGTAYVAAATDPDAGTAEGHQITYRNGPAGKVSSGGELPSEHADTSTAQRWRDLAGFPALPVLPRPRGRHPRFGSLDPRPS